MAADLPVSRVLNREELRQLLRMTDKFVDSIPENIWDELQKITLADLLESPTAVLAFNSFLANHEKLKLAIPVTTDSMLLTLRDLSKEMRRDSVVRSIRADMFKLLNSIVSVKKTSK